MKIAIVGSSTMNYKNCLAAIQEIINVEKPDEIISGGANGVDSHSVAIAVYNNVHTNVILPKKQAWIGGFRERNLQIADQCDKLYNLVIKNEKEYCYHHKCKGHIKSGGCWTELKALEKGKEAKTIICEVN